MEARPWAELGFLGCCPSSDLYLLCVILTMPLTSLHLRLFISKTGTTWPMSTTLSLSSCDVMPVNDLWIKSVYTECRWPTSACQVWLMCWEPCFLSGWPVFPQGKDAPLGSGVAFQLFSAFTYPHALLCYFGWHFQFGMVASHRMKLMKWESA